MTYTSQAPIPQLLRARSLFTHFALVAVGALALTLLAQIAIPLPFTPVPITGQTFGVALLSLLYGFRLGLSTVTTYITAGFLGLPIFAGATSGLITGPTAGYLIGMIFASALIGFLADRGWSRSYGKAYLACLGGSLLVFSFGLLGLSYFLPKETLWASGVYPFLFGDLIKSLAASAIAVRCARG